MEKSSWNILKYALGIGLVLFVAYLVYQNSSVITSLTQGYGLIGMFLAALIANATVFFPILIEPILFVISGSQPTLLDAIILGVVMGIGAGIGEMSGYLIGMLGLEAIRSKGFEEIEKTVDIREKIEKWGMAFIYFGAIIPFPFDLLGVTAGLIRYDFKKFFIAGMAGKTTRYVLISIAGFYGLAAIKSFFNI